MNKLSKSAGAEFSELKKGDRGETLKKLIYESTQKTIIINKGTQFIVRKNNDKILEVIFPDTPDAPGLFMVYKRDAKKIV